MLLAHYVHPMYQLYSEIPRESKHRQSVLTLSCLSIPKQISFIFVKCMDYLLNSLNHKATLALACSEYETCLLIMHIQHRFRFVLHLHCNDTCIYLCL